MKLQLHVISALGLPGSRKVDVEVTSSVLVRELVLIIAAELGVAIAPNAIAMLFHRGRTLNETRHLWVCYVGLLLPAPNACVWGGERALPCVARTPLHLPAPIAVSPHAHPTTSFSPCSCQEEKLDSGSEVVFALADASGAHGNIVPHGSEHWPVVLQEAVGKAVDAFHRDVAPQMANDGEGSTYFLYGSDRQPVACFKPQDEEPFTPCNRKGWVGAFGQMSFRRGILSGEGCLREAAAYMLDHGGLARVPATAMVTAWHSAFGNGSGDLSPLGTGTGTGTSSTSSSSAASADRPGRSGGAKPPSAPSSPSLSAATPAQAPRLRHKVGSFQEFVHFDSTSEDWAPSKFSVEVRTPNKRRRL
jgi:hypothetical protein